MSLVIWKIIGLPVRLVKRLLSYSEMQLHKGALQACGRNVQLARGACFEHPEFISIGEDVTINIHAWFSVVPLPDEVKPQILIGKGSYIGRFFHISCTKQIVIGDDVLISDRVFITDSQHGFQDTTLPISLQPLYSPGPVEIGSGTWLGIGVSVMPNVKIGRHCVIGANAVVTHDIPDYHIAAGIPARIIRRID